MSAMLSDVVDLICLVYHEARSVRLLLRQGKLQDRLEYGKLVGLPENRRHAWREMGTVRGHARAPGSAVGAAHVFHEYYGLSLTELQKLYEMPCWHGLRWGGKAWAAICSKVLELIEVTDSGDAGRAAKVRDELLRMRHNSGAVGRKLQDLKSKTDASGP